MIVAAALILLGTILPMTRPLLKIGTLPTGIPGTELQLSDAARFLEQTGLLRDILQGDWWDLTTKLLNTADSISGSYTLLDLSTLARELKADYGMYAVDLFGHEALEFFDFFIRMPIILTVIGVILFLLPLCFTLLGGLRRSRKQTLTALGLMVWPQLLLNGPILAALTLAALIVQAIFCARLEKRYDHYLLGMDG